MLDYELILSNKQAITATTPSTNILDMLVARDIGAGQAIQLQVYCTTTFLTLTSLQIALQGSADNSTFYSFLLTPVIPVADLVAGNPLWKVTFPSRGWLLPNRNPVQYYGLSYIVGGSNATAGNVTAYLSAEPDQDQYFTYPRNYTA